MKKTKLIAISLAALMTMSLFAGCGNNAAKDPAANNGGTQKPVLTMATNATFPPYEFYENEKVVGIDVEIAQAIADKLGMELKVDDMEFGSIITAIQAGKADIGMAGMTVTEDRLQNVNFTTSYATGIQVVIVKEDSPIKTIDDLNGKKIGVQESTTGDIYASDTPENGGYGEDAVDRFNKGADAVMALSQGKVDAVIIDNEPAKAFVAANKGLKILDTEFAVEDYAIAIGKKSDELMNKINKALEELIADGTVKKIIDKYITAK